jgi:hypothetical protein
VTDHDHDLTADDAHEPHPVDEDPRWVLLPLIIGLVIGIALIAIFGLVPGAPAVT